MSLSGGIPLPSDGTEKTMTEHLADITSMAGEIVQSASLQCILIHDTVAKAGWGVVWVSGGVETSHKEVRF